MKISEIRPKFSRKEWYGFVVVIALFVIEFLICIAILSGGVDTDFIYKLDLTGEWSIEGERWSNISITYRELMIPVYISANILMWMVFITTFLTRDWANIAEWEKGVGIFRLIGGIVLVMVFYWFPRTILGMDDVIYDANELSRFVERPAFSNKSLFFIVLAFFVLAGYYGAEYAAIFMVKIRRFFNSIMERAERKDG